MEGKGEDKLIAVARHIVQTLGRTETMTDDILQIFSSFDCRFSKEKMLLRNRDEDYDTFPSLESLELRIYRFLTLNRAIWGDTDLDLEDSIEFLDAVDELLALINDREEKEQDDGFFNRADNLLLQVIFRLEHEFEDILEQVSESFELNRFDGDDVAIKELPAYLTSNLHEIAKRMISSDFGKFCSNVYISYRRDLLEDVVCNLGLKKLSIEEVSKMPWQDLESDIKIWIATTKISIQVLFPSERHLCHRVFEGITSNAIDNILADICRATVTHLFSFVDAIAITSRSPERIFRVLDMFETLKDLMPEFEVLFSGIHCSSIRSIASDVWNRLQDSLKGFFTELEILIQHDPAKSTVPNGALHPITRYVLNYLTAISRSRLILDPIFTPPHKSLSQEISSIAGLLEQNLEMKSKQYTDPALRSVFLMNNLRYAVKKARDNDLGFLLGDDWIRKQTSKIRLHHLSYSRSSWYKILAALKLDGLTVANASSKRTLREKFKLFNLYLDEIIRSQSTWIIHDEQLRTGLIISVRSTIVPAYRNFVSRCQNVLEVGKHSEKSKKYSVEDVERMISGLFQGNGGTASDGKK